MQLDKIVFAKKVAWWTPTTLHRAKVRCALSKLSRTANTFYIIPYVEVFVMGFSTFEYLDISDWLARKLLYHYKTMRPLED